ncbi:uncharacterized protein LOC122397118 isoform X1 [Colletes gigas]|uniref:uncharacterized protein LOC122397118 isoform X1 n=1 Tax=Colletes gigas TaxID=935657 RepID=UPI001C9AE0E5|nr:uncharacterized protein LOC122397118 isoform X1 [Colletes gigas]XP_043251950.1 uncharacterized protein LOC122397118 isoform X1 [Colletes gigas]
MPFMIESRQTNEINNKDREHFLAFKMKDNYSFKYIPESHFKQVVKSVQRQRRKEDEERIWTSFVKEQELNSLKFNKNDIHWSMEDVKDLFQENMQDIDTELKRLREDALPECNKGICSCKFNNKTEKTTYVEANSVRDDSEKQKFLIKDKDTNNTDIQIPILQGNVSNCKETEGTKRGFKSKAKISLSDPVITQKKHYTSQLLHTTNHFENNSDSDLSNNRSDIVCVQPDPLIIEKILSMQKKVAELLNEISFRLCKIPLPDGDRDLKRRQQQTTEFAIRFSRNYLYNLNRLLVSIQRHVRALSINARLNQCQKNIAFHQDKIKQELIAAYQLLIQALNAYCKHIPNSTLDGHPKKLQNVLQIVCDLRDICNKVEISTNYLCAGDANTLLVEKELQDKIDGILSKLKLSLGDKCQSTNHRNIESTVTLAPTSLRNKRCSYKKNLSSRLSMYSVDVPKTNQRRKNNLRSKNYSCQKEKKYNVVETKNTHNRHCLVPELLYPSPVTQSSSSRDVVWIDEMKNVNYLKEDDIRTMMDEVIVDSDNNSNLDTRTKCSNTIRMVQESKVLQKKPSVEILKSKHTDDKDIDIKEHHFTNDDDLIKKVTRITKGHLSTLVPVISGLMTLVSKKQHEPEAQPTSEASMETLIEFLQKYQSPKDSDTKASSTDDSCKHSHIKLNGLSEIQKYGENVQLVCVSSMDKESKLVQCDASCQADNQTASISDRKNINFDTKNEIVLNVSKETELQFLAYRHEYKKMCQSKPMYSSSTQNKPWDIVAWISDKLVEELMIEIANELQMPDLIQKMFEMEFQEV